MWQYPRFRTVIRVMTIVWGVGYVIEALVRVGLSFLLAIPVFLIVSPLLAFAVTIGLISWTVTYARAKTRRRAAELRATSGA
jgi:phosphate/sulfate permease